MSAFWRVAGMDFLQYQNVAAQTLRSCLKDQSPKSGVKARDALHYRVRQWKEGVKQEGVIVNNLLGRKKPASTA